jgi:hypothetical protein
MRSALYYPHSSIKSERILKRALLLWDSIEFIAPWEGYQPEYGTKRMAEAAEIVARPHVPSLEEMTRAHEQIEEFATRSLPSPFYLGSGDRDDYEIYPEKLLPDTWKVLRQARLAEEELSVYSDGVLPRATGLSVMSIIADCCAGTTRVRVTDRGPAYATITNLLQGPSGGDSQVSELKVRQQFVSITLNLIDAASVDLSRLIEFRKREARSGGHIYRDLRHRYVDRMEAYVRTLTQSKGTRSDGKVLARELMHDMKDDLAVLGDELGFAKNEVLFSRDMIVAAVAGLGTIATSAFGLPFALSGVVTAVGSPVMIGGLLASRNKFRSMRKDLLQKHPMAYLYQLETSQKAVW